MRADRLIDIHLHGIGRYDTRTTKPADILKMAELEREAGVSAILPTIYAAPIEEMRGNIKTVCEAMKDDASILGVNLEGPFLNPSRCGAQSKSGLTSPSLSNLKRLINGFEDIIKIITVAPELPGALKVIERCTTMGIRVNMGHSDATFRQAFDGKKAGATGVTHIFNAMRPLHHREPGLLGLALTDKDLYVEVIADGVHIHPEILKLIFKIKPIDRIILVSDFVKGPMYKGGLLQGGKKTLPECAEFLAEIGIPKRDIIRAAFENPKRYLKRR